MVVSFPEFLDFVLVNIWGFGNKYISIGWLCSLLAVLTHIKNLPHIVSASLFLKYILEKKFIHQILAVKSFGWEYLCAMLLYELCDQDLKLVYTFFNARLGKNKKYSIFGISSKYIPCYNWCNLLPCQYGFVYWWSHAIWGSHSERSVRFWWLYCSFSLFELSCAFGK